MNHPPEQLQITHCPTCGSKRIQRITRNITGVFRGRKYIAKNVAVDHCSNCGEELFDPAAMQKIEAARRKKPATSAASHPRPKHRVSA